MWEIMNAYVIMHNMIVESERDANLVFNMPYEYQSPLADPHPVVTSEFSEFLAMHLQIHDETTHDQLQSDLVARLWACRAHEPIVL